MSFQTAQPLLEFIRRTETGRSGREAYDVMYGHKKISPPLTQMTLDQAIAAGPGWTKAHKSSAAGAYQFMNDTLKDLKRDPGYAGILKLTPEAQDMLGYALLQRRGFEKFLRGEISVQQFGLALAQEWASFPVLAVTKGAHRQVARGETYYAGDALNKALVKPEAIEALLTKLRADPTRGEANPDLLAPTNPNPNAPQNRSTDIPRPALLVVIVAILGAFAFLALKQIWGF